MTFSELKSTLILGLIFATRLLGLFMVLPVLALYVGKMPYATPALIGVGAGIYGLTQALFQLPFGVLSDYLGRKPVIVAGLVIFIIGSLIAAFSETIVGLIIGRAIQGMGAIGSPILALVADLTREQVRTRAMALIGVSIGVTFVLAVIVGPLINAAIGLSGIFLLTAMLGLLGIFVLYFLEAAPQKAPLQLTDQMKNLLKHPSLWRLSCLIFMVHAMLTAFFLVLPAKIEALTQLSGSEVWRFYLPVLLLSLIFVAPLLRYADKSFWQKKLMQSAILGLGITIVLLIHSTHPTAFFIYTVLFFLAFNYLEASLPALVSRMGSATSKGSALGVYSFSQFLGMFTGGILGGCLQQWMGPEGIGLGCLVFTLIGYLFFLKKRGLAWQEELIK